MPNRRTALALSMSALVVIALSGTAQAGGDHIRGNNQRWHPATVTISEGTRVTWRAVDVTHTVTAYGGNWSKNVTISAGEHTRKTFHNAGTFKFRCTIHSTLSGGNCTGMCGRVEVT